MRLYRIRNMGRHSLKLILSCCVFFGACLPEPEPNVLGILVVPYLTQTSDQFLVESTFPSNGQTFVSLLPTISITFTQLVESSSITANINCATSCPTLNGSTNLRTVTLLPATNLNNATTYTITLDANIKSTLGFNLGSDYNFSFSTE